MPEDGGVSASSFVLVVGLDRPLRLRQCLDADLKEMHMTDLCRADEEEEVRETLWELYSPFYYEVYAVYAGRSQWPLIRQVDVYTFFDDAQMLDRGPMFAAGGDTPHHAEEGPERRLNVQDVNQILLRTVAVQKPALRDNSHARRRQGGSEVLRRSEEPGRRAVMRAMLSPCVTMCVHACADTLGGTECH